MKELLNIRLLSLLCLPLFCAVTLTAQRTNQDIVKKYLDLSLKYNKLGNIDSSLIQYNKAIALKESSNIRTMQDSISLGVLYSFKANIEDYLESKESVIESLKASYAYFSISDLKNDNDKVNQINTLKSLLYHLLDQNLENSKIFEQYVLEFKLQMENFKHDRNQYMGYNHYLASIDKIKNNGFTRLDKVVFDAERHGIFSQLLLNYRLKYLEQIKYLKNLKEYKELSPRKDHRRINSHLVTLLGDLSYYSLFESEFEFSEMYAKEALSLKMRQWWIATNLIHAVYLQGRLEDAKELYYRYRDIKHINGETLGELIRDDIEELQSKNICDSDYINFLNTIDEEISIEFPTNIVPTIPIVCEMNGQVETSCTLELSSYKWTHDVSGEIKIGRTVTLDRNGIWTLRTTDLDKKENVQKIYVDTPNDLKYTQIYLRQSSFVPIPVYLDSNEKGMTIPAVAFTKGATDFVNIDTVANYVLNNFKIIKDLNGESIIVTSKDLCSSSLETFYDDFRALNAGLLLVLHVDFNNSEGTLYMKAKDNYELFPIIDSSPKYNQLFHLQEILPNIIKANSSSYEIARVLLSNMFMGHPIGGW